MTHTENTEQSAPEKRECEHAKLLRYGDRQALAFLQRGDESEALQIVIQLWVAACDHQLRVAISIDGVPDEVMYDAFEDLDDERLAQVMTDLGVQELIESFG